MENLLFARTFMIVGGMLVITAITARMNKAFETSREVWLTIGGTFVLLFATMFYADFYPLNLLLVAIFSGLIGWTIGPTIAFYGTAFRLKRFAKSQGIMLKKGETLNDEQRAAFARSLATTTQIDSSHSVVSQAMFATACAVFATAGVVFLTNYDFSFLGGFLFIALLILIAMGLLNILFYRSSVFSLVRAYIGVVLFTLYLIFDFDRLEKMAGDQSWGTAVDIAVNIYLDIINLFLSLLEILGDASD